MPATTTGLNGGRARRVRGRVYLVGAGPGDARLITLRGAQLLRRADVVLYDSLVGDGVLDLARAGAERIDVGKRCGGRRTAQAAIHRLLIDCAQRHRIVVRLKGGDPLIFGRGGEEALALRAAGVPYEIVPGITAAAGIAAYAGIPLTHRGTSTSVTLVTGHGCADGGEPGVEWDRLAGEHQTLAIYMGTRRLDTLALRLIAAGRARDTPAAIVECGTHARQRTVTATLGRIAAAAERAGIGAPALVLIGEAVALQQDIGWFEQRPLHGVRIVVARTRPQPSRLARRLAALGAEVTEAPRFTVQHADAAPLRRAVREAWRYSWTAFTDAQAVHAFARALGHESLDARAFAHCRFAAFGSGTAAALARAGIRADIAAPGFDAERIPALFTDAQLHGAHVLFPHLERSASPVAAALRAAGARVQELTTGRAVVCEAGIGNVRERFAGGAIDLVVFPSSASVTRFREYFGDAARDTRIAAIGPATAAAAAAAGLDAEVMPVSPSARTLVEAIHARYAAI